MFLFMGEETKAKTLSSDVPRAAQHIIRKAEIGARASWSGPTLSITG